MKVRVAEKACDFPRPFAPDPWLNADVFCLVSSTEAGTGERLPPRELMKLNTSKAWSWFAWVCAMNWKPFEGPEQVQDVFATGSQRRPKRHIACLLLVPSAIALALTGVPRRPRAWLVLVSLRYQSSVEQLVQRLKMHDLDSGHASLRAQMLSPRSASSPDVAPCRPRAASAACRGFLTCTDTVEEAAEMILKAQAGPPRLLPPLARPGGEKRGSSPSCRNGVS